MSLVYVPYIPVPTFQDRLNELHERINDISSFIEYDTLAIKAPPPHFWPQTREGVNCADESQSMLRLLRCIGTCSIVEVSESLCQDYDIEMTVSVINLDVVADWYKEWIDREIARNDSREKRLRGYKRLTKKEIADKAPWTISELFRVEATLTPKEGRNLKPLFLDRAISDSVFSPIIWDFLLRMSKLLVEQMELKAQKLEEKHVEDMVSGVPMLLNEEMARYEELKYGLPEGSVKTWGNWIPPKSNVSIDQYL